MTYRTLIATLAYTFLLPLVSHAGIVISEVALMGTTEDANNEWIELHNEGGEEVNVDGWTIEDGNTFRVTLQGMISGNTFALLERTDDTSVPSVTASQIYTGALANDGRTLTLKRGDGTIEDRVVGGEGWSGIGGDNTTKDTPQRTSSGWVTGTPTPGAANISYETVTQSETTTAQTLESGSQKKSGGSSKAKRAQARAETSKEALPPTLSLRIEGPQTAYMNQPVSFKAIPGGLGKTLMNSLAYTWNFGDTYTASSKEVSHVFRYPGEYIVIVHGSFAKHEATVRHEVTVLPVSFTLSRTREGDVELRNNATYEVDMSGFILNGGSAFKFPKFSYIKAGGTVIIPKSRAGDLVTMSLYDNEKSLVSASPGVALKTAEGRAVPRPAPRSVSSVPVAATAAQAEPKEPKTPAPTTTVIRIGSPSATSEAGLFSRFMTRIAELFGS